MFAHHSRSPFAGHRGRQHGAHHQSWGGPHRGRWGGGYRGAWGEPWGSPYGGPWGGPWRRSGQGQLLKFLAAAFLIRAALRGARGRFGPGHGHGHGHPGHGPWGWGQWGGRHEHGGWGKGGPWRRGGRHHGGEHDSAREAVSGLRSEVGPLVALLRDAVRHGGPDARQMDEIRTVLGETRRRLAAILAEERGRTVEL